ncbi:MAG: ferredoxin--NADP reductase [Burkholderiaceae bacterium]
MNVEDRAVACAVTWRRDWAPHLFSFRAVRPAGMRFVPGQFVRLGVTGADGTPVWRAYSIVSPPAADHLEFYSIVVPDGPFTQPLARIEIGDTIRIDPTVYGFLRADRFEGGETLWLLATGTGIAPFMAMLADDTIWSRYGDIVVVHSVRRSGELAYRDAIEGWVDRPRVAGARLRYLPTLTGDEFQVGAVLHGRITTLLDTGELERKTGLTISKEASRLMICGNPSMIRQTRALLGARGMTPVRREVPGQFIVENFW